MAKVGAKIGLTLKLFKDSQYEFIRPEISIEEIDTDGDVALQLKNAVEALKLTWQTTSEEMNKQILAEMPNVDKQMEMQVSRKLKAMDDKIAQLAGLITK